MNNQAHFNKLEQLVDFLDKEVLFQDIDLSLNNYHFYRLHVKMNLLYQKNNYHVQFLGTNHTRTRNKMNISASEKKSIDKFTRNISKGSLVLTEQGSGEMSRSNHFKDLLKSLLEQNPELDGKIRKDYVFCQRGELDYAADKAYEMGAEIVNMDIVHNPLAIGHTVHKLGLGVAIEEIKSRLQFYIPHQVTLNRFVYGLLTEAKITVDYQNVETQRCRDVLEPDLVDNEMRDNFMSQSVLTNLQSNNLYVIAHTAHIRGILQRIYWVAQIDSLSASLEYTPEKMFVIQNIRELRNQ